MEPAQTRILPWESETWKFLGFWDKDGSPHSVYKTRPKDKLQTKKTCRLMDIAVPLRGWVKTKEWEKRKYLYLAVEQRKLWSIRVTVIPVVTGTLGTAPLSLVRRLEELEITGKIETIQITALLRSARILRKIHETWGDILVYRGWH